MLIMVKPSYELENEYLEMSLEYVNSNDKEYRYKTIEEVRNKIQSDLNYEAGRIPEDKLQAYCYWVMEDEKVIGTSRLRPKLNERFEKIGGNIGYDVSPSYRRKGYGKKVLKMTLEEAKKIGMREVLITCNDSNIGSCKIIEANNGELIDKVFDEEEEVVVRRYRIKL